MTHREIVGDFYASDLTDGARLLLMAEASELLETISVTMSDHRIRPGIPELLAHCRQEGIPVGIVSNAHSGRAHRRLLDREGLAEYFGVQVYSDEVGIRKPNPRMITIAAEALGVPPEDTWYVGDTQDRDMVAGRRAGVGAVLLTRSKHTDNPPFPIRHTADAVLDDPRGVLEALHHATPRPDGAPATEPAATGRSALLIDHGGVISVSESTPEELARLVPPQVVTLGARLGMAVPPLSVDELVAAFRAGARTQEV